MVEDQEKKDWREIIQDLSLTKEERIQAAFHLENSPAQEDHKLLAQVLFTEPSPIVRHEIAFALGETSNPEIAAPALMKAVQEDQNVFVRHEAILALATIGKEEFIPFVKKFLDDPIIEMAESAEIALQRLQQTPHE